MKKTRLYTIIIFSFCSALLDFLTANSIREVFPRNRIIHIIISLIIALAAMYIIKCFNYDNLIIKYTSLITIISRMLYVFYKFTDFFKIFHGSNTVAITLLSSVLVWMFWKYIYKKADLLYSFFIIFNISMTVLIFVLCADKVNAVNIYSVNSDYSFAVNNLFIYFDILTISILGENKENTLFMQKKYLMSVTAFMIVITLLQGLCIGGNVLYSISSLQSLLQIFYTDTVKRFDYIFAFYYILNYFAVLMLYTWAVKFLTDNKNGVSNEKG